MIIYSCSDETLIVSRNRHEAKFLKEYFGKGTGRNLEDYDRTATKSHVIAVRSRHVLDV